MQITVELNSRKNDVVGACCECCQAEKESSLLRIVTFDLSYRTIGRFIICVKCLAADNFSVRK